MLFSLHGPYSRLWPLCNRLHRLARDSEIRGMVKVPSVIRWIMVALIVVQAGVYLFWGHCGSLLMFVFLFRFFRGGLFFRYYPFGLQVRSRLFRFLRSSFLS